MACLRKPRVRQESTSFDLQRQLSNGDSLDKSLPWFLLQLAQKHVKAEKINWMINAVTDEGVKFSDFDAISRSVASWLWKKGVRRGEYVWVALSTEKLHCILNGIWMANGTVRSAFLQDASALNESAVVKKIKELGIKMIFCNITNAAFYLSVALNIPWPVYVLTNGDQQGCVSLREIFDDDALDVPALEILPSDPALLFASVTSSVDVVHSHKTVISLIESFTNFIPHDEQPLLISSNLTNVIGVLCPFALLYAGRTGLMIPKPERRDLTSVSRLTQRYLNDTIYKYKPNAIIGVPSSLEWICKTQFIDYSTIQFIHTGGGSKSTKFIDVIRRLPNFKSNITGYWLKETGLIATARVAAADLSMMDDPLHLSAVGNAVEGVSVKIIDIDTGEALHANLKGEIVVKTDICRITRDEFVGADGWFRTGDLGFLDKHGLLHVTESIQDKLKCSLIYSSEIEEALCSAIPPPPPADQVQIVS